MVTVEALAARISGAEPPTLLVVRDIAAGAGRATYLEAHIPEAMFSTP